MGLRKRISLVIFCSFLSSVTGFGAHAAFDSQSKFALPLSASFGIGTMENSDLNLESRMMNALSLEALPSYRIGKWLIGPHLDYRLQGQMTSISEAGGTNLKGEGYLLGLGLRHDFTERFFLQGAVDFFGEYDLSKNTSTGEDDKFTSPLSLRVKTGYAFIEKIPNLTFDADLQYLTFSKIHIAGSDQSAASKQLMVSVGLTYRFGSSGPQETPATQPEPKVEPSASTQTSNDVTNTEVVQKIGNSVALGASEITFESGSAQLNDGVRERLKEAAEAIAKSPNASIRVEGHADSSGGLEGNETLSQARAESVKAYLIENGISTESVSAQGFGSSKPIADNETKEGRAKNRRVEIYRDSKEGE